MRCFYADDCGSWRWSGPLPWKSCDEDIDCQKQRCRLNIAKPVTSQSLQRKFGQNMISGTNECYEQITGQQNGCYKQDLSYRIDQPERYKLSVPKRTWGECALTCKEDRFCTFWTWASTSCSNCVRGTCDIFSGGDEEPNFEVGHRGHISGSRHCQDIGFKVPRGPRCQKFTPPYVIEQCFQLGIVNRGVRPNFVKHGVPLRRCLGSGAFYRYQTLQPNFSLRWAVERGFAYDRTTKIKSEICKHLCLRLQLVALLKTDSRACLTLSFVQAIRLTP